VLVFGEIGYIFNLIFTFPIFNALMLLYHLFGDFGLSIVVLTLIIRLILFPLTLKQLKSMKATQALQPRLAEIKKKYAKDQQAQLVATQALYKEYGINPAAGCLPMLIQLPVLYGLFYGIEDLIKIPNVQALNHLLYPFIPHFAVMPDLNLTWLTFINPALQFSLAKPDPTHILPIIAGLATFIQLRMSQPKNAATSGASDPTAQSMKMMQYVMPLITVFFAWTFAAGLALYWTVSSIFQAMQQYFVTGWGSLLITPDFLHRDQSQGSSRERETGSRSYTGDQRREREIVEQANGTEPISEENTSPSTNKPRTGTNSRSSGGGSAYTRRRRGSSASARRRGSTQRSRS
jgi:YidC/Oxa1 family membrane protein insertase